MLEGLPADDPSRAELERVADFARVAADNLDISEPILKSIAEPIQATETIVDGKSSTLNEFSVPLTVTVALMFVTLLLAAGMLALEREEHAFGRLVRGLVSRLALVVEKVLLAALCAFVVCLVMLVVMGALYGVDFGRALLWVPALLLSALAFAALGVAIGCLAREVRSASLLVFALSLPMAALALVPSGAVFGALAVADRRRQLRAAVQVGAAGAQRGGQRRGPLSARPGAASRRAHARLRARSPVWRCGASRSLRG